MKVEEIAEAVTKLPPDELARFRRWFTAFEAGRPNHAEDLCDQTREARRSRIRGIEKAREGTVSRKAAYRSDLAPPRPSELFVVCRQMLRTHN